MKYNTLGNIVEFKKGRRKGSKNKYSGGGRLEATMDGLKKSNKLKAAAIGSIVGAGIGGGLYGHGAVTGSRTRMALGGLGAIAGITGSTITGHKARQKAGYYKGKKVSLANY